MDILQPVRAIFAILGIEPLQPFQKNRSIRAYFKYVLVLSLGCSWFILLTLFLKFDAVKFQDYTEALYDLSNILMCHSLFLILFVYAEDCFAMMDDFINVMQTRSVSSESRAVYVKMTERIKKLGYAIFLVAAIASPGSFEISVSIRSYFLHFTTVLGPDAFITMFPMWLPFDFKTPFTYPFAIIFEAAQSHLVGIVISGIMILLIACCMLLLAYAKELRSDLSIINDGTKNEVSPSELMNKFKGFIDFHATVKQLATDVTNVFNLIILVIFTWSFLALCGTLSMIQMELSTAGISGTFVLIITLVTWSIAVTFLFCKIGERINSGFEEILDDINQCDWFLFPTEVQKMLPLIIRYAQQPVVIRAFGRASCDRYSFKTVANSGFSYFMILRRFQN